MNKLKIILVGGHHTTALALIEFLSTKFDCEFLFLGHKHSMKSDTSLSAEYKDITGLNIRFVDLNAPRFNEIHTLRGLLKLLKSTLTSTIEILKFKPKFVFMFGGYLSVPVGLSSILTKTPYLIHDQTIAPGKATKLLAKFSTRNYTSFDFDPALLKNSVYTGNLIRLTLFNQHVSSKISQKLYEIKFPVITIFGGKQGSHFINEKIFELLKELTSRYTVIHITGSSSITKDYQKAQLLQHKFKNYFVFDYLNTEDMSFIYKITAIFVSRSGANSISEFEVMSKKAILIPLEPTSEDEQLRLANYYAAQGNAVVIREHEFENSNFLSILSKLIEKPISDNTKKIAHLWTNKLLDDLEILKLVPKK